VSTPKTTPTRTNHASSRDSTLADGVDPKPSEAKTNEHTPQHEPGPDTVTDEYEIHRKTNDEGRHTDQQPTANDRCPKSVMIDGSNRDSQGKPAEYATPNNHWLAEHGAYTQHGDEGNRPGDDGTSSRYVSDGRRILSNDVCES